MIGAFGTAERWRLLDLSRGSGAWNQAVDEALLDSVASGASEPVVRVYGWNELCVSIGLSESVSDVSAGALNRLGATLVRRHSGGTVVVHQRQVAYALVLPAGHRWALSDVTRTYEALGPINLGLAAELGVLEARLATPGEVAAQGKPGGPLRAACLAWLAPFELTWHGRKLVGHSQVRRRGCVLHHCVVNLDFDAGLTSDAITSSAAEDVEALSAELVHRVTSLSEALGRPIASEEVRDALLSSLKALGVEPLTSGLSGAERADAERLDVEKYRSQTWTYRR